MRFEARTTWYLLLVFLFAFATSCARITPTTLPPSTTDLHTIETDVAATVFARLTATAYPKGTTPVSLPTLTTTPTPTETRTRPATATRRAESPSSVLTRQPTVLLPSPTPQFTVLKLKDTLLLFQSPTGIPQARFAGGYISNDKTFLISEGELDSQTNDRHVRIKIKVNQGDYADGKIRDGSLQHFPFPLYSTIDSHQIGESKAEWPVQYIDGDLVLDCWVEERVLRMSQ